MDFENEDIFEDDLDLLEILEFGFPRRVHVRANHFDEVDQLTFFKRFRLYKGTVLHLLTLIENDLEYPSNVNNSVSPINQLLICLRYYATGGHLSSQADFGRMDISTVSRIIVRVSEAVARLYPRFIKMPTQENIVKNQASFYSISRFPKLIGVIDGTHIRIQSPGGENAEVYRNRKSYFSINAQVICDSDMKFSNVVARWPGSVHDSTVFINSAIRARFENGEFPNSFLLGDSGYPLRPYLLTPLGDPVTRAQQLYNESLIRTRNIIERTIGVWKRRFPVLACGIRLKLETTLTIIVATAVLHNIAREMNEPEPPQPENMDLNDLNYLIELGNMPEVPVPDINIPAELVQNQLIENFFANL